MAFERRGNRMFYYQSYRTPGGRVRKLYLGSGIHGVIAAEEAAALKAARLAQRSQIHAFISQLLEAESLLKSVHTAVNRLAAAKLYCSGYYLHAGSEWRRRRR